ncbi:hypothetical protein Hamer_G004952 [Homarus americanus]|uniref:Uncharacterized protein n=1 Tax=Homarus americanus TaxID=6706 RepID=A0A8J5MV77_HOMAM|nr:hypothetical protein Hamer_G004952 [Homarus americanus]
MNSSVMKKKKNLWDQFYRDLYAEAAETNVEEKFTGTADTADKLQENDKFADKQDFAEKFAEKFAQKFVDKFTEKKLEEMGIYMESCFNGSFNGTSLATTTSTPTTDKWNHKQQQQQQNECGGSWTFKDGYIIMVMGYLLGYLFNSVVLVVLVMTIIMITRSVIKRRSITVNSIRQQQQQQQQQNECGGSWTFRDGYIIMVMGYLFNSVVVVVLVIRAIMVIRRVIKRRSINVNIIRQDSLPDNDTLAISETPPPSYFELEIDDQNCCDYISSITSMLTTPPPATHLPFKIKSWFQKFGHPLGTAV